MARLTDDQITRILRRLIDRAKDGSDKWAPFLAGMTDYTTNTKSYTYYVGSNFNSGPYHFQIFGTDPAGATKDREAAKLEEVTSESEIFRDDILELLQIVEEGIRESDPLAADILSELE